MVKLKQKEDYILQQAKNQFFITVPTALALAMGWKKGTKLKFRVIGKGKLEISD